MTNHVSDLMLERYNLGEVTDGERAMVEADPSTPERLKALRESDVEIREEILTQRTLSTQRRRINIFPWRASRVISIAAAALVVIAIPLVTLSLSDRMNNRIKGPAEKSPQLYLYMEKQNDGEAVDLKSGAVLGEGDTVQLAYKILPGEQRWGVIFSKDGRGTVTLHFPYIKNGGTLLSAGGRNFLSQAYTLDDAPRFEDFFMVSANRKLSAADVLQRVKGLDVNKVKSAFPGCDVQVIKVVKK
jgi:hypothetical protein